MKDKIRIHGDLGRLKTQSRKKEKEHAIQLDGFAALYFGGNKKFHKQEIPDGKGLAR